MIADIIQHKTFSCCTKMRPEQPNHTRYQGICIHCTEWYEHITNKNIFLNQHKICSIALLKSNRTSVIRSRKTSRMSLCEEEEEHTNQVGKAQIHTYTQRHVWHPTQSAHNAMYYVHGVVQFEFESLLSSGTFMFRTLKKWAEFGCEMNSYVHHTMFGIVFMGTKNETGKKA